MANVLGELFGDIATAIREKNGEEGTMKPAQFPEKISSIETGADVSGVTATADDVLAGKKFVDSEGKEQYGNISRMNTANSTLNTGFTKRVLKAGYYTSDTVVDADPEEVTVTPTKETQTVVGSGRVYMHSDGFGGSGNALLSSVTVDPIPDEYQKVSGVTATADDVRAGKVFVDAEGNEIGGALSGTIADVSEVTATAEDVLEGKIIVNSSGNKVMGSLAVQSGGGSLPAGLYWKSSGLPVLGKNIQNMFSFNGEIYCFYTPYTSAGSEFTLYKLVNNTWTALTSKITNCIAAGRQDALVGFNGKIHLVYTSNHWCFDGTNFTKLSTIPASLYQVCVFNGQLIGCQETKTDVYAWDETTDTWSIYPVVAPGSSSRPFVCNDELYFTYYSSGYKIAKVIDGVAVNVAAFPSTMWNNPVVANNKLYATATMTNSDQIRRLFEFDPSDNSLRVLGYLPCKVYRHLWVHDNQVRLLLGDTDGFCDVIAFEVTE